MTDHWQDRVDAVWDDDDLDDGARLARIDALAAELTPDDARGLFERAGARDSAGSKQRRSRCTAPHSRPDLTRSVGPRR